MDAALSVINVVGKKLLDCKRAYDALAADCEDLLSVLQAMEHLLKERSKEKRLEGAIQQQFMKALLELRATLDDVTENMQGAGKVALWCGTLIGKGAAKASKRLQRHVSLLKDLLAIADAEAGNVTASAVEEIAGGAAGKLIPHEGMRSFWREQFKNDFQLSWDQFLSGLRKFDHELQQTFNESLPDVLRALRLTLDPTRDGMISVNEFAGFLKGSSLLHAGADIVEVIKFQFSGTRHLLPSIAVTHHAQLTACATNDHTFATGDAAGFIKFYVLLRDQVAHTGFAFINAAPTAMAFAEYEEKAHLLAGFAGHCVVIDCASYEIVATFDTFPTGVRSIAVAGDFVLLAAPSPESRIAVYRRVDRPGEGEPITLACQGHLVHSATPREVESAGDGRHCITWTVESGVMVWDFRSKVLVHRLPGSSFCAGFCARPYVDPATKEPRCAIDVFMPPTELHWDDVLSFAGKRIDTGKMVESPVFFAYRGYSQMYSNVSDYGLPYMVCSVFMFFGFTDMLIYWAHRGLHHPYFYKYVHKLHHVYKFTTPFSSHAFHPLDGFTQGVPYYIFAYLVPIHSVLFLCMFLAVNFWTISIHDQVDFGGSLVNSTGHHTIHHELFNYNYGQYFTLWDRVGGTYKPAEKTHDLPKLPGLLGKLFDRTQCRF